ncbi:MAG TPA: hypothetical protein VIM67_02220, partial [Terriglobus sp.]
NPAQLRRPAEAASFRNRTGIFQLLNFHSFYLSLTWELYISPIPNRGATVNLVPQYTYVAAANFRFARIA